MVSKGLLKSVNELTTKIVELKENTGIAVDIQFSTSNLMIDYIFYADKKDTSCTHWETVNLESCDAEEKLEEVHELVRTLNKKMANISLFNNQLN